MRNVAEWCKAAGVRAIRTMAQTAISTIGSAALITEINWAVVGSATLLAGALSLLMSLTGLPEVDTGATGDDDQDP